MATYKKRYLSDEQMAAKRARTAERRASGQCHDCGADKAPGWTRCDRCAEKRREAGRRNREARKAAGLPEYRYPKNYYQREYYQRHKKARAEKRLARIAAGICLFCPSPATAGQCCGPCAERRKVKTDVVARAHVAAGRCRCGRPRANFRSQCAECIGAGRRSAASRRAQLKKRRRDEREAEKLEVYAAYGGVCVACGYSDHRALTIDHVNNDGSKERRGLSASQLSKFHAHVKAQGFPPTYQLLCRNCNWIKHIECLRSGGYSKTDP